MIIIDFFLYYPKENNMNPKQYLSLLNIKKIRSRHINCLLSNNNLSEINNSKYCLLTYVKFFQKKIFFFIITNTNQKFEPPATQHKAHSKLLKRQKQRKKNKFLLKFHINTVKNKRTKKYIKLAKLFSLSFSIWFSCIFLLCD